MFVSLHYSQAGNVLNTIQGGVDPRNGLFNICLPLVVLPTCNLNGSELELTLY